MVAVLKYRPDGCECDPTDWVSWRYEDGECDYRYSSICDSYSKDGVYYSKSGVDVCTNCAHSEPCHKLVHIHEEMP